MEQTRTRKEAWLLCLLAVRLGKAVDRTWLAGTLWPDSEESRALANLRRSLSNLRDCLGPCSDLLESPNHRTLCLRPHGVDVDVVNFDSAIESGAIEALRSAVVLYHGPLLEECTEDWAHTERVCREQRYLEALEKLAKSAFERQDWTEAIRISRLSIASDPLQEMAHRTLIEALGQSGNAAAVTQAYRDLRIRLREELNAEPDAETRAVYERVRASSRSISIDPVRRVESRPAQLHPTLHDTKQSRVSHPITRLVGREEEIDEVSHLLTSSRLVTLTGAGGIGKTRFALELINCLQDKSEDGAAFVDLAPLSDPTQVSVAFADALKIKASKDLDHASAVIAALTSRNMLLVIDNCEHLLSASCTLVQDILEACIGIHIVATSRQSLGIPGEVIWRVPSLSVPPEASSYNVDSRTKQSVSDLLDYASVQLFVERLRQGNPQFRLTTANLPAIADICRKLDGIPLAIELAAGRARALSLEQIAARIDDRFKLLTGGSRTALPRQQTLLALIEWSYALLDAAERKLLMKLSVFAGGWSLEAAQYICGEFDALETNAECTRYYDEYEVLDNLSSLVDKSLVILEENAGRVRYRMLETIRAFARDLLAATGDAFNVSVNHATYYAERAVQLEPLLLGPDQAQLLDMLEADHDNIRAAIQFAQTELPAVALHLTGGIWRFWMQRGHWLEGRDQIHSVLEATLLRHDLNDWGRSLHGAGVLAYRLGDLTESESHLNDALAIWQELEDYRGDAASRTSLGHVAAARGLWQRANQYYDEAIINHRRTGCVSGEAYCLMGKGNVANATLELPLARELFERALELFVLAQDPGGELLLSGNMGTYYLMVEDPKNAIIFMEKALNICRDLQRPEAEALYLPLLGVAAEALGDVRRARSAYRQALRVSLRLGDKRTLSATLATLAAHYFKAADYSRSAELYGCANASYDRIGFMQSDRENQAREYAITVMRGAIGDEQFKSSWDRGANTRAEECASKFVELND